jgi:hypothetical protein
MVRNRREAKWRKYRGAGISPGKKHIRVRPKFRNWALMFTITVWDEQITADVLKNIFQYAGAYKGLCDWRPGGKTPGSYGMFTLKSMHNGK